MERPHYIIKKCESCPTNDISNEKGRTFSRIIIYLIGRKKVGKKCQIFCQ